MFETVLYAVLAMLGLSLVFCIGLVIASTKLAVHVDPVQAKIESVLPGANCGGCGLPGCGQFAKAVFEKTIAIDKCTVGGPVVTAQIAEALGVEAGETYPYRPVIHCGAKTSDRLGRGNYKGEMTCAAANVVGGFQGCVYGCLGLGDCVVSCKHDAMVMRDGLPVIDYVACIGCGDCVRACPRQIIEQIPFKVDRMMVVACSNHDPGKAVREVCKVGCIGCNACTRLFPDIFVTSNNLARVDYSKYTGKEDLSTAVSKCPMDSMIYLGKPLPQYEKELEGVAAVTTADKPAPAERPTGEDMNWRG